MSEKINCTRENCEKKLTRDTFNHHYTKQCRWRTVSCEHCSDEMVYCMLQVCNSLNSFLHISKIHAIELDFMSIVQRKMFLYATGML